MSLLSRTAGTKWSKLSCRPSLIVVNTTRTRAPLPRKLTTPSSNMEPGSEVQDTRDVVCLRYVDVGVNLSDPVFRGIYHGRRAHDDDLDGVVARAVAAGCLRFMVTGSDLAESKGAVEIARKYPGICFATVGVHPCSVSQFDAYTGGPQKLLSDLKHLAQESKANGLTVAFGEIGLDYDRLHLTSKEQQLKYFRYQLDLATDLQMPLFLHMRAACENFVEILQPRLNDFPKRGLVHSFTGSKEELRQILEMGFDVGVNGCSLKTEENLEVTRSIPLDRLQIETDAPWCEMRASHASSTILEDAAPLPKAVKKEKWTPGMMVKGRNEPALIARVAHVVAKLKNIPIQEVCDAAWRNSTNMFGLGG